MRASLRVILAAMFLGSGAGRCAPAAAADLVSAADEQILKAAKVGTAGPDLLAFFRKRTLGPADLARIGPLIKQLGAPGFRDRKKARLEIDALGPPALAELRRVVKDYDGLKRSLTDTELEARKNALECIEAITKNPGPALPLAALRLLDERKPAGCCPILLAYLPFADNAEVEEEVKEALLSHGKDGGRVDAALLAALQDKLPLRRAAAGYALGRMGDIGLRPAVRALLGDADASVRQWAAYGLVGKEVYRSAAEAATADRKLFETHKLPVDDAGLLAFFRKRTLSPADQARLHELVAELGSKVFRKRARASRELAAAGSPALVYLRAGAASPDVEIASRARRCITQIETGPDKTLALAATRQIMRRAPAHALEAVLGYIPFADDEDVVEEAHSALCALAVRDVKVSAALTKTLEDPKPPRRAAAAFVLGRVGTRDDCRPVRKLVGDVDPTVRFQVAQTLLVERDKAAIPILVALLDEAPFELASAAEDVLATTTGAQPTKGDLTADKAARKQARGAWSAWWQAHQGKLDLTGVAHDTPVARTHKARKVCATCLDALLHLNVAAFKKSLKFPFYMEGLNPGQSGPINSAEQIDQFFKMLDGIPQIKQELKQMAFTLTRVTRLDEYLAYAPPREKGFLEKLRKPEIYIVHIAITRNGMAQPGGGGAMFVRMTGGRAWVIGLGNPRTDRKKK